MYKGNPNIPDDFDPDPESCMACTPDGWLCAYHAGFDAGVEWSLDKMSQALDSS